MKIKIVRVPRCPQWPLWAVLLVSLWLTIGSMIIWRAHHTFDGLAHYTAGGQDAHSDNPIQLCLFKRLTNLPCPTCGFTRGVLYLLSGQIGQAWLCNPFLFSVLGLFFAATLTRILFARTIQIHFTRIEYIIIWVLILLLFAANWAYIILYVG